LHATTSGDFFGAFVKDVPGPLAIHGAAVRGTTRRCTAKKSCGE
jgi:hypothetical protein